MLRNDQTYPFTTVPFVKMLITSDQSNVETEVYLFNDNETKKPSGKHKIFPFESH